MTNFEYIIEKRGTEFIKELMCRTLAVNESDNEPCKCSQIECCDCKFANNCPPAEKEKLLWLNSERTLLYKEGDIVITYESDVLIVQEVNEYTLILVNRLKEPRTTYIASIIDIKRKVGSINE